MKLNGYLFHQWHLAKAVWEHFGHVESWHVMADETQSRNVLVVNAGFPTNFENLGTVNGMSELELLHIYFNAYFR